MSRNKVLVVLAVCSLGFLSASPVGAQYQEGPATQPTVTDDGTLVYEVIEVKGKVRAGPANLVATEGEGWSYVKVGDRLGAGLQIIVPFRSAAKLVARPADPPTVILIERMTRMSISELALTEGTAKSRIELAYGAIKAGVAEGRTRSDMEITCPGATLSKRGTDIFAIEYRNGKFRMSLSDGGRGMIQAIQMRATAFGSMARMRSRFVTPGQFVTHQMARAIDNVPLDRQININDVFGLTGFDQLFTLFNDHGLGFLLPQGANPVGFLDVPTPDGTVGGVPDFDAGAERPGEEILLSPLQAGGRKHNDGDFGIGQGVVPGVFGLSAKSIRERAVVEAAKKAVLKAQGRRR
ncbi:MAG: FecR domain-containing protein [Phycisphaerae bacterium]|nr:FecR domain-containing protein [Phycisphaerae bacterium]